MCGRDARCAILSRIALILLHTDEIVETIARCITTEAVPPQHAGSLGYTRVAECACAPNLKVLTEEVLA
jgi:hypothetical protein